MRVVCSKCGYQFESVIFDRQKALNEIEVKSTRHMKEKHGEEFAVVATAIQTCTIALSRLIHFGEFIVVPEQEDYVKEQLENAEEVIALACGFDEVEEEEEGDDAVGDIAEGSDEGEEDEPVEVIVDPPTENQ